MPSRMWFVTEMTARMQDDRDERMRDDGDRLRVGAAGERRDDDHEGDDERDVRRPPSCAAATNARPRARRRRGPSRGRAGCAWRRGCRTIVGHDPSPSAQRGRRRPRSATVSATEPIEGEAGHVDALVRLHAVAEIPDQMAHAAEHVVHQRPRCSRTGSGSPSGEPKNHCTASKAAGPAASATSQIANSAMPT